MNHRKFPLALVAALSLLSACGGGGSDGNRTPPASVPPPSGFTFQTFGKSAYARVDRTGQPVVATVLLVPGNRNQFNSTDPAEDGDYSELMLQRLEFLHNGLDEAIIEAGLTPCALDVCARQVVNQIIPDTLQYDLSRPDGYPNGRRFEDITVDRILSAALLDTTTPGDCNGVPCDGFSLERLPLNPVRNESPFLAQFPYLAAAHPPP